MPCLAHQSKLDKKCVACFAADIVDLAIDAGSGIQESDLDRRLKALGVRYGELKLGKDDEEYCRSVIFGLNAQLVALKRPLFCAAKSTLIAPSTILEGHRTNYRDRIRQMGTWIGFTELEVLANIFRVGLHIAIPTTKDRCRLYRLNNAAQAVITNHALLWTGNHYELATITPHFGNEYNVTGVIATNPLGDCAFESFLLAIHHSGLVVGAVRSSWSGEARGICRVFERLVNATEGGKLLDCDAADYLEAIGDLRKLLASDMTQTEVNNAIIAEGVLPSAKKSPTIVLDLSSSQNPKILSWTAYRDDWMKRFNLKKTVTTASASEGSIMCVANIGAASDWLAVALSMETYDSWSAMRTFGLRAYGGLPLLKHTGFMLAHMTTKAKESYVFVGAASNYHESWVNDDDPFTIDKSPKVYGKGDDMHTERFCLVRLYEWITAQGLELAGTIDILWFLEKPMCDASEEVKTKTKHKHDPLDACQPVLRLFIDYWEVKGVKVISVIFNSNPTYRAENLKKALKPFTSL